MLNLRLVRLFHEYVRPHLLVHALVIVMMAVVAACTAASAYLLGNVINQAYLYRDFSAIVVVCIATFVIFTAKGFATYGYAVAQAWVNNRIGAENQRRMAGYDARLLRPQVVPHLVRFLRRFLPDRHRAAALSP